MPLADSLVSATEDGLAVDGPWFTKHFLQLLPRAGLPVKHTHDLGRGAAPLLVDAGAHPEVARELLRHAPAER